VGIGLSAGFFGGTTDEVLMRCIDVLLAFPGILLAILIVSVLGSSLLNVIVALAVFSVPIFARMARGSVLATKNLEYVDAARAVGAATPRILLRHIVPNILGPIVVYATLRMASAILGGATLSFLGMGLAPPAPEWGLMVALGRQQIQSAPYVVLFPGLAIFLTVLAFNLLGDALRDVIDPRSKPA
jgi:peptide/nickel transport system permease protein